MSPSDDPRAAPRPAGDPAWGAYGGAVLEFPSAEPPVRLDLRLTLPASVAARLAGHVGAARFGIVTPANPAGAVLAPAANAARLTAFAADLVAAALPAVPADGCDPATPHREAGFAIVAPAPTIRALAARWQQTAFYWFDGRVMWLVPTHPAYRAVPLPADPATLPRVARNPVAGTP